MTDLDYLIKVLPVVAAITWALISMYFKTKEIEKDVAQHEKEIEAMRMVLEKHEESTIKEFKGVDVRFNEIHNTLIELKTMLKMLVERKENGKS